MSKTFVYISSWKKTTTDLGLSVYEFDSETGELKFIEKVENDTSFNVTYYDKKRGLLYALDESADLPGVSGGGGGGRIFTFKIDPDDGKLIKVVCTPTWCSNPAFMTKDKSEKYMIIAHHGSKGSATKLVQDAFGDYHVEVLHDDTAVELFSMNDDGTPNKLLDVAKHDVNGQGGAHPHSAVMSPSGKLFAVCDKGNDTVRMYGLDAEKGKLIRPTHIVQHARGTLPRYCVFHPEKPWFYHNNEKCMDLHAYTYTEDGFLQLINTASAAPENGEAKEKIHEQQGLVIDAAGKYIYDISRGPNVVAVFEINQSDGSVKAIQYQSINGKWPRGCALSPDGRFLLVCCLGSEKVVVYAIGEDGRLTETGLEYSNAAAAYAIFCEV